MKQRQSKQTATSVLPVESSLLEPGETLGEPVASPEPGILRPGYEVVNGHTIPVRAQGTIANYASPIADQAELKRFELQQTQPAVRNAVADTVGDSQMLRTGNDVMASSKDAFGFKGASNTVKADTQAGFQKIDDLSNGEFSDAQAEADQARGSLDYAGKKAYDAALAKQQAIFDRLSGQATIEPPEPPNAQLVEDEDGNLTHAVSPEDQASYEKARQDYESATANSNAFKPGELDNLKQAWIRKNGLDDLATRFDRTVEPTPSAFLNKGEVDPGYINAGEQRQLGQQRQRHARRPLAARRLRGRGTGFPFSAPPEDPRPHHDTGYIAGDRHRRMRRQRARPVRHRQAEQRDVPGHHAGEHVPEPGEARHVRRPRSERENHRDARHHPRGRRGRGWLHPA